jgi:prepilin-type N-terminal cleavage/methylation domain-containing protein
LTFYVLKFKFKNRGLGQKRLSCGWFGLQGRGIRKYLAGEAGFTLPEILVVLVIIGVLAGVATISLNRNMAHWELRTAARTMVSDLRAARDLGLERGVTTRVYLYRVSSPMYYKLFYQEGTNWIEKKRVELPGRVRFAAQYIDSSGFTKDCQEEFRFSSSGNGVPTYSGTARLENTKGESWYVIVSSLTGRVRESKDPPP